MVRRRIKKRWILMATVVIAVVIVVVLFAIAPRLLRHSVESQLVSALGGEVEIGSVKLGTRWHEAYDIQMRGETSGNVWLTIDKARFELPLTDAVGGRVTPYQILLDGLEVTLRLDEQGQLVEPHPELHASAGTTLPNVVVVDGRVVVEQPGRSTVVFDSIAVAAKSSAEEIAIEGSVGGSPLGALSGNVTYDVKDEMLRGNVTSKAFQFNTDKLSKLPAITALADTEIGYARGTIETNVSFALGKRRASSYRAELRVSDAEFGTPDNAFHFTKGEGRVIVEDGIATLSRCTGRIARGNIAVVGTLDLRSPKDVGQFNVELSDIPLPLPARSKRFLSGLVGSVSGGVKLNLRRDGKRWIVGGTGNAHVDDAVWDGMRIDVLTAALDLQEWQLPALGKDSALTGTLQLGFQIVDADLAPLVARLSTGDDAFVEHVTGDASLQGDLRIPLRTAGDPLSYRATATVQSRTFAIAGAEYGPLSATASLRQGRIQFEKTALQIRPSGRVTVQGSLAVLVPTDSRFTLVLDHLPTRAAAHYFKQLEPLEGDVNGTIELVIPYSKWAAPARWQLTGSLKCDALSWKDVAFTQTSLGVTLADGRCQLQNVRCQWKHNAFEGDVALDLGAPFRFDLQTRASRLVVAEVTKAAGIELPAPVVGLAEGEMHVAGTLEPMQWTGAGHVSADALKLGDVALGNVTLPWQIDSHQLEIKDAAAKLLGGTVQLTAVVPLRDIASSRFEGHFESWDMGVLSRHIALESIVLKGTGAGHFSAEHVLSPKHFKAMLQFNGVDAVIRNVVFQQLDGRIDVQQGTARVLVDSKTLDGTCSFQGQARFAPSDWTPQQIHGKATLRQFRLQNLWSAIGQQQRLGPLHAIGDVELNVQMDDLSAPVVVDGSMKLSQVRWGRVTVTEELSAKVNVSEGELRIEDIRVRIDRGAVVSRAVINLANGRGEFRSQLHQVPLNGLLAFAPRIARKVRGNVEGELTGVLGERWNAAGVLRVDRATVAGVPLTAVRLPVRISRVPESGRTRVDVSWQSGRIASGKAKGHCHLFWSGRFSVDAAAEVTSADLRPIAKAIPGVSDLLGGRVSAKFDLKSGNLRMLEDLTAKFDIHMQQAQTLRLPGVRQLTTALGLPSPGAVTFAHTTVQGDLQRSVVRVKQMTLESPETRLWIDGQLDLRGTMDFNVTADAGPVSAINVAAATVSPVALLRRRLLFFQLSGSLRHPTVQVRTDQFLAQEVIFFFLPIISLR